MAVIFVTSAFQADTRNKDMHITTIVKERRTGRHIEHHAFS
jgi:hypothetical protein